MTNSNFNLTNAPRLLRPMTRTSVMALTIGLTALTPAAAQEAVVIADGEVVTDQQVLGGDADSLTIDAGGTLDVDDDDAIFADGNNVIIENAGTITSDDDRGIVSEGDDTQIINSGSITAGFGGIETDGDNAQITNSGSIDTEDGDGILSNGDNAQITNSGIITAEFDGIDSNGDNDQITNSGTITSLDDDGIDSDGDNAQITNSGTIVADNEGIESDGDNALITNSGSITSLGEEGIDADGDNDQIMNSGSITSDEDGIESGGNNALIINSGSIAAGTDGIEADGDDAQVTNSGSITSFFDGIDAGGDNAQITNSGTISAEGGGVDSNGIESSGINAIVFNSGTIKADNNGIDSTADNAQITNSGTITAASSGILSSGIDAIVTNSGQIFVTGANDVAVQITGEGSALTNTGLLSSTDPTGFAILGGDSTQTVTLGAGSQVIGAIDLGDGADTLNIDAGSTSAVLSFDGVETLNLADDLAAFETTAGVVTVDLTGVSVLNEATATLGNDVHAQIAGRFALSPDLATQGTPAVTSGAWASIFGQARSVGDDGAALAYSHDFAGVMAGYDLDISAGRVGFVGGVSTGEIATDAASQDITSESLFAGAYLNRNLGAFDVTGSLLAGVSSFDSERLVIDNLLGAETATASFDSQFVSASVNAKTQAFMLGDVALVPSVTATYTAASFDGYTEDGTTNANLEFGDRSAQTFSGRAQLASNYLLGSVDTQLRGGIDARTSSEDDISATLNGTTLDFAASDSDSFLGGFVGARAVFSQTEAFSVVGDIEVQFGERETQAVAAGLNVSFSF